MTVTQDNTNDLAKFGADDVSWATSTITYTRGCLYKARRRLARMNWSYFDFGSDQSSVGAAFTVQFNANGILQIKNGS